jgi:hypothetical protein
MLLIGLQLVMTHGFIMITNRAKCLQRREKSDTFCSDSAGGSKSYDRRFFTYTTLIVSKALPKGRKFNQNYFISTMLLESVKEKQRLLRRK